LVNETLEWPSPLPAFDAYIFTAAPSEGDSYQDTYLENSKKLAGLKQGYIIYTSSTSVYGDHQGKTVDETSPLKPINARTEILVETEQVLLNSPLDVAILRLGEIVGPGRELERKLGKTLPAKGDSIANLSPLQLIESTVLFFLKHRICGIYNVVSDQHMTRKDLYEALAKKMNRLPPIWDEGAPSHHGGNRLVSGEKLKNVAMRLRDTGLLAQVSVCP
jgi:nucleoside-diphosphate-sugar epimerase